MSKDVEKSERGRLRNGEKMKEMRDAEDVHMGIEKKKAGDKGKRREKRFEKQREEAERNRKKSRMTDWLCRRKLNDDGVSGMERDSQDVPQN